jgi:hypothetical protein
MSLIAASLTKSAVVGLMPSVEFTPVFSPTDCPNADVEIMKTAAEVANVIRYFIVVPRCRSRANRASTMQPEGAA